MSNQIVSVDIAKLGYEMAVQAESMGVLQNSSMTEDLPYDDKESSCETRRKRNVKKVYNQKGWCCDYDNGVHNISRIYACSFWSRSCGWTDCGEN